MERMMERKLAVLEAEYNACLNAEHMAAQQRTLAAEAAEAGDGRVGHSGRAGEEGGGGGE